MSKDTKSKSKSQSKTRSTSSQSKEKTILDVPNDIIQYELFARMDPVTRANFGATNKSMRELYKQHNPNPVIKKLLREYGIIDMIDAYEYIKWTEARCRGIDHFLFPTKMKLRNLDRMNLQMIKEAAMKASSMSHYDVQECMSVFTQEEQLTHDKPPSTRLMKIIILSYYIAQKDKDTLSHWVTTLKTRAAKVASNASGDIPTEIRTEFNTILSKLHKMK